LIWLKGMGIRLWELEHDRQHGTRPLNFFSLLILFVVIMSTLQPLLLARYQAMR